MSQYSREIGEQRIHPRFSDFGEMKMFMQIVVPTHVELYFFVLFDLKLSLLCPVLPVSLDCPFLIAP
jgi:hypothetical protein